MAWDELSIKVVNCDASSRMDGSIGFPVRSGHKLNFKLEIESLGEAAIAA